MPRILPDFTFDRLSFWLGFLAATLLWLLLAWLRPVIRNAWEGMKARLAAARRGLQTTTEERFAGDILRQAQKSHLAAALFSLDEILIAPRLLAPPAPVEPEQPLAPDDITDRTWTYLPDWPEIASLYHAPTLTLAEALQGGTNLAVIGAPGSGKSVALAYFASLVARHDPDSGDFAQFVPVLLHAADLQLPAEDPKNPLATLIQAAAAHASALVQPRLATMLKSAGDEGRLLLLLDGLDECTPTLISAAVNFLTSLMEHYPRLRVVVAASPEHMEGLLELGFVPMPLATWDSNLRSAFIRQWSNLWTRVVSPLNKAEQEEVDPLLINGWLLNDPAPATPLETTLKIWAAYAGDSLGATPPHAIEAYVRRMTVGKTNARLALEKLAAEMTLDMKPVATRKEAENWIAAFEVPEAFEVPDAPDPRDVLPENEKVRKRKGPATKSITAYGMLPGLADHGLVNLRPGDRLTLVHPVITGYLAAVALPQQEALEAGVLRCLAGQPEWTGKFMALQYLSGEARASEWVNPMLQGPEIDLFMQGLLRAARWLPSAPENTAWRAAVMRQLATTVQNAELAFGIRARALAALVCSGSAGVGVLLRQWLTSPDPMQRRLAAMGCGALQDVKAVPDLENLLDDELLSVRQAACLGLVAVGTKPALEAVASALLSGDELLRRAAAEALANNPEEGFPTLEEGSSMPDLMVRRAVVFGLARVRQPWAVGTLEKMQSDGQWAVQSAVNQELESLRRPNARVPRKLAPLTNTPWLIAFAGEQGMGVAPGKPAMDLLYQALHSGSEEQRLATLYYLTRAGDESSVLPLYQVFYTSQDEIRETTLNALWHLGANGITLPMPMQFGYK